MKLMVASYNNGAVDWNGEAEETKIRSYTINHKFNRPAECIMTLADIDGSILQKYNADANDVYLGVGKITLEDPTGTDIFYGRIIRAVGNTADRTVTLECKDWLDQLDDELITYDMREKLGTTNLRQSKGRSDPDGERQVVYLDGGVPSYLFSDDGDYDDDGGMGFANDQHNGQWLIFTTGMAGTKTWRFHPYQSTAAGEDTYSGDVEAVWVDNDTLDGGFAPNDWTLQYDFHVELGHNTPSDFYVHDSITGARVHVVYQIAVVGAGNHSHINIDDKTDGWIELDTLDEHDHFTRKTYELNADEYTTMVDANGIASIQFDIDRVGGNATIAIKYLAIEVDVTTTGYSTAVAINDTHNPNLLRVVLNLTQAARQMWEQVPYCVCKEIHLHLESATGPILGGDTVVTLTAGAGDIENTAGLSTRQYKNKSRLDIIKDLAMQDKSNFHIALGTSTVIYKQTYGADTEQMTDGTPDSWQSVQDYSTLFNSIPVYGARIGDYEIYQLSENAASKIKYRTAKTKIIADAGLVADADALAIGTAIAARDSEIQQMVGATLSGLDDTYRLGTIVEITSSYLWSTAAKDYIVVAWGYDSKRHKTTLLLHPKVSIGMQDIETGQSAGDRIKTTGEQTVADKTIPDPITHEVA